jgi:cytochrome b subunit of formate dehydrogenase
VADGEGSGVSGEPQAGELVKRHRLSTRLWHWLNVVTVFIMLMSGLSIFNAHPRLYLGGAMARTRIRPGCRSITKMVAAICRSAMPR